jgi:hypothetical protein
MKYLFECYRFRTRHNNGMHPTADTEAVIISRDAGRRVMPGVMPLPIMKLIHSTLFSRVEIDSLNGVYSNSWKKKWVRWKEIVGIVGLKRAGTFTQKYLIGIAIQDAEGQISNGILLETSNEWEYRYFIETTVSFMKENYDAVGGQSWCARHLDTDGDIVCTSYDFYQAFVLAKILTNNLGYTQFDRLEEECERAAYDFIAHKLDSSKSVDRQISEAIGKLGFMPFTSGYMILDSEISRQKAEA